MFPMYWYTKLKTDILIEAQLLTLLKLWWKSFKKRKQFGLEAKEEAPMF